MDRIDKVLRKLSSKECSRLVPVLQKILAADFSGLDFKKLKGKESTFRVRKGRLRIIFKITMTGEVLLLAIDRRDDQTYA